jgi:hypothetical protein
MALQVWLPLNGNLENKGIDNIDNIVGTPNFITNGKISTNCLNNDTRITINLSTPISLAQGYSIAC